jgi:hypothetical protein
MKQVLGTQLSPETRQAVLNKVDDRFTCDRVPSWALEPAPNGKYYAPHYRDDQEWLANTWFTVNDDGKLSKSVVLCESKAASWPIGVWLDNPYEVQRAPR